MIFRTLLLIASCCSVASSAEVTRYRVHDYPYEIEEILIRLGAPALMNGGTVRLGEAFPLWRGADISDVVLTVDGEPAMPWQTTHKILAFTRDTGHVEGSVELTYRVRWDGLTIQRRTTITDGHLVLDTRIYGRLGQLDYARFIVDARERGSGTRIVASLTAGKCLRCRLVARIFRRLARRPLDLKLRDWERTAVRTFAKSDGTMLDLTISMVRSLRSGLR